MWMVVGVAREQYRVGCAPSTREYARHAGSGEQGLYRSECEALLHLLAHGQKLFRSSAPRRIAKYFQSSGVA
jgi:hypothetical protein